LGDNPYEDPLATIGGADAQVPDGVRWSFGLRDAPTTSSLGRSTRSRCRTTLHPRRLSPLRVGHRQRRCRYLSDTPTNWGFHILRYVSRMMGWAP